MGEIKDEVASQAKSFGIDVIDVRIRRADLPAENSRAIFDRMISERTREAKEFRAQGAELAQGIRARAERSRLARLGSAGTSRPRDHASIVAEQLAEARARRTHAWDHAAGAVA